MSVGIVTDMTVPRKWPRQLRDKARVTLKEHYLSQFRFVPGLKKLLEGASLKEDGEGPAVKAEFQHEKQSRVEF